MAGVPFVFGNATTSIPLTNLDANFNTGVTIGNTTVGLGNTVTTLGNVTLTNTIASGALNGTLGATTPNTISATTIGGSSTIGVGAATPSASGAGITFPATQSASSNVNTLDDYEEGTWTPTYTGFTIVGAVAVSGTYTKIGRVVRISGQIYAATSISGGSGGSTYLGGLPFPPAATITGYATATWCDLSTQTALASNAFAYGNVYPPTFSFNSGQTLFFTAVYQTD